MRKLWYAGAVAAGGFLLFGLAAPAQADLLPGTGAAAQQADERLDDLLNPSDGVTLDNPLRYSTLGSMPLGSNPIVQYRPGKNGVDVKPEASRDDRADLPDAQVVGGALRPLSTTRELPIGIDPTNLPVQGLDTNGIGVPDLIPGGLPMIGGGLPVIGDGGSAPIDDERPTFRRTEATVRPTPLLGGLGGILPIGSLPRTTPAGEAPDTSGLPAGGVAVDGAKPRPAAVPDDPRLHEEPIDNEAGQHRPFTASGRPVAGIDQQYR